MGCASSKQARRDLIPITPLPRSYSLPVHHPAQRKGDSYHVVALTSTTLGTLKLDPLDQKPSPNSVSNEEEGEEDEKKKQCEITTAKEEKINGKPDVLTVEVAPEISNLSPEVYAARKWSIMVEQKISRIPRTPVRTPPGEPETINAWELMEGLEDTSPLRSFSFHGFSNTKLPELDPIAEPDSPKPLWIQTAAPDTVITDFDPEIISNFRKALQQLSPPNTCRLRSPELDKPGSAGSNRLPTGGSVQERIRAFQKRIDERLGRKTHKALQSLPSKGPPRGDGRVVVYFTSLRGVRKTYEDCCQVRLILRGCGVRADERDVSMHHGFREELYEILGGGFGSLPRVFVKGRYLGGAEEVRQMHEAGELEKLLEGCEPLDEGGVACEGCGDVRFVPCDTCNGSCKVYVEEEDGDGDDYGDGLEGGFLRCPDCNENGIIRCPVCCS